MILCCCLCILVVLVVFLVGVFFWLGYFGLFGACFFGFMLAFLDVLLFLGGLLLVVFEYCVYYLFVW